MNIEMCIYICILYLHVYIHAHIFGCLESKEWTPPNLLERVNSQTNPNCFLPANLDQLLEEFSEILHQ